MNRIVIFIAAALVAATFAAHAAPTDFKDIRPLPATLERSTVELSRGEPGIAMLFDTVNKAGRKTRARVVVSGCEKHFGKVSIEENSRYVGTFDWVEEGASVVADALAVEVCAQAREKGLL